MSGSDLPPEVLAALRSTKAEVVSEPEQRPESQQDESDDDYFDRHRRGGWLLR